MMSQASYHTACIFIEQILLKIAKIHWVLVVSASVKITLLQKPAYSAVHNCNST